MKTVNGLILAAGFSSRMGSFKMGLNIGGISMIERTVLNIQPVCDKVIIVCGYKKERVIQLLEGYDKVVIVENEKFENGMFSSVQAGLRMMDSDRVFIQPGDIPFVSENIFKVLLSRGDEVLIPSYMGRKGHPVLISRQIKERILAASEASKLNQLFYKFGYEVVEVDDDSIHFDIDDIHDLKGAKRYL